jgi:hypothetical protein
MLREKIEELIEARKKPPIQFAPRPAKPAEKV